MNKRMVKSPVRLTYCTFRGAALGSARGIARITRTQVIIEHAKMTPGTKMNPAITEGRPMKFNRRTRERIPRAYLISGGWSVDDESWERIDRAWDDARKKGIKPNE